MALLNFSDLAQMVTRTCKIGDFIPITIVIKNVLHCARQNEKKGLKVIIMKDVLKNSLVDLKARQILFTKNVLWGVSLFHQGKVNYKFLGLNILCTFLEYKVINPVVVDYC